MKIIKKILYLINKKHIILILIILIAITSTMLLWLQQEDTVVPSAKPAYHFYLVGQNSVDPFWKEVRQGAESAARDHNVVVEFNAPRFNNPQEEQMYLDIAITSNVDGIITHVSNDESFTALIDKAYDLGIPVVTIENDAKNSNRNAFVGTNSFVLGKEAAKLMIDATNGKANIVIIVSNDYEMDSASQNLKISGFLSTIKDYPGMNVAQIYVSRMGILSAEEITQSIINRQLDINAVLTTNSVDTFGAAQLIVDQNKVGTITLVGYGDTVNILRYIKNNIIYGTVMSDPYKMGYEGVKALLDIKEKNNVSTFIDTGVKIITKGNLDEYEMKADLVE
ncbi:substrate-binding domain-containing protein [Geosporobacter ferrireducens]|uniref:Sugar ABC transporter substrate-binding protein n=1 Tax=Geosporobacter ferrireducens TaxID=1424294 RepID=A0A1D8GIM3_9FIRM|nr:substrate-binding domain-containing protein [Geosporobacter ferrireducens]AOT70750.1 sugar ABC transporter substrate-binding protein [Geosporobacter ferrireducens]MTI57557.1 sugar ABC transporter substrate-binding protein [Geosporobacter ferrireducens]